jgi:hypothetical protein
VSCGAAERQDASAVIAHEFGHALEDANPHVRSQAQEFLARRTVGETAVKLNTVNSGCEDWEIAKPDKFSNLYMGKIYKNGCTEITSMGVQAMYSDPGGFMKADPEFFHFILGQLSGARGK